MARLVVFLIFLAGLTLVASLVSMIFRKVGRWNHVLRQVTERYGGYVRPGGAFTNPSMQFPYGQHFCHLRYRSHRFQKHSSKLTEFSTHWPDRNLSFRLSTPNFPARLKPHRKLIALTVADEAVNERYQMESFPMKAGKKLLNEAVCWEIEQLSRHGDDGHIRIVISGGLLTVQKPGHIRAQTEVDDFVRFCLSLLDQLTLTNTQGIEFEESDSAKLLETVYCPICSEEILEHMVVCVRCKTPHCQDCWEYNGQCATFACGEERFLSATAQVKS